MARKNQLDPELISQFDQIKEWDEIEKRFGEPVTKLVVSETDSLYESILYPEVMSYQFGDHEVVFMCHKDGTFMYACCHKDDMVNMPIPLSAGDNPLDPELISQFDQIEKWDEIERQFGKPAKRILNSDTDKDVPYLEEKEYQFGDHRVAFRRYKDGTFEYYGWHENDDIRIPVPWKSKIRFMIWSILGWPKRIFK